MAAIFRPGANYWAALTLLGLAAVCAGGIGWLWFWPRTDYARHVRWFVGQPVPFSHEHHVAGLGIDCRFCHTSVEVSSSAGLPPSYTCMTCHSQIWTNAALLAPVRRSLIDDKPIVWNRINDLPDYVYFNHSIHIAKGVGCSNCHGEVDRMPPATRPSPSRCSSASTVIATLARICGQRIRSTTPNGIGPPTPLRQRC
jgi:hypothetical protein